MTIIYFADFALSIVTLHLQDTRQRLLNHALGLLRFGPVCTELVTMYLKDAYIAPHENGILLNYKLSTGVCYLHTS